MTYSARTQPLSVPTPSWVPDDYGRYWRACCTVCTLPNTPSHPPVPPWYTNARYSRKTTWWQKYVRKCGFKQAVHYRQAFLTGFKGVRGTWWCGSCLWHKRMMDVGEALGYPNAHDLYALEETRDMSGYGAWLYLARYGGSVLVQTIGDAAFGYLSLMREIQRHEQSETPYTLPTVQRCFYALCGVHLPDTITLDRLTCTALVTSSTQEHEMSA